MQEWVKQDMPLKLPQLIPTKQEQKLLSLKKEIVMPEKFLTIFARMFYIYSLLMTLIEPLFGMRRLSFTRAQLIVR